MTFRIKYFILAAILAITPLLVYNKMVWGYFTPKHLFFQLTVSFLPLLITLGGRIKIRYNSIDICAFILLLLPVLHTLVLGEFRYSKNYLDTNLYLLIYYLSLRSLLEVYQIEKLIRWITYTAGLMSLYGILQYFNFDPMLSDGSQTFGHRVVGSLGNANSMGSFMALALPLSIYHALTSRSYLLKRVLIPILISIGLILSLSRGAIIGLVASSLIFLAPEILKLLLKYVKQIRQRILVVGCIIIILSSILFQLYNLNTDSAQGRLFIWRITAGMIKEQPVSGIGYGRYGVEYLNYQANFFSDSDNSMHYDRAANMKQSDNEYLQVWAELGLFGLLTFLVLMGYVIRKLIVMDYRGKSPLNQKLLIKIVGITILTVLIHSLVDNPLRVLTIQIVFYFCFAISAIIFDSDMNAEQKSYYFSNKLKIVLVMLSICLAAIVSRNVFQKSRAYMLWQSGQDTAAQGYWKEAIEEYQQASNLLPGNYELKFHLGAAYSYTKQPEKALPLLEMTGENFNDKNLYIVRGATYLQLYQFDLAEENFKQVISMYPKLLLPRLWLAELHINCGRLNEAEKFLKEIISIKPKNMTPLIESIKKDAIRLLNNIIYTGD